MAQVGTSVPITYLKYSGQCLVSGQPIHLQQNGVQLGIGATAAALLLGGRRQDGMSHHRCGITVLLIPGLETVDHPPSGRE